MRDIESNYAGNFFAFLSSPLTLIISFANVGYR